jgi:hypothetical protein
MHVLRAEKGYPIIGQDTDGTVTPQDLGMAWAVAPKSFIGSRSHARSDTARPDRKHFVGLLPVDPEALLPEGAQLVADVAEPCHVEVTARANDESMAGGLLGPESPRVDLTSIAGKVVRLVLTARDCPRATIQYARITLHGPDPQPLPASDPPKFVILWVMDALRADKIPIFTPGARAQTPNLDELAKSSAVFRQYYVQGNESQTSHSSIWTSLYPAVHNVRLAGEGGTWRIERRFDVIGDELKKAGFTTLGVTGNGYVNEDGGYARGFDEFRNMMRETGSRTA